MPCTCGLLANCPHPAIPPAPSFPPPVVDPAAYASATRILFWNVYRLGQGSPDEKIEEQLKILDFYSRTKGVSLVVLCEVTSTISEEGELACQSIEIEKLAARRRRDKRADAAQLGYAAFRVRGQHVAPFSTDDSITITDIDDFDNLHPVPIPLKGGVCFLKHSKRHVMEIRLEGKLTWPIFVYHANASDKANVLVPWVANALKATNPKGFLLVGDLNCEPWDFPQTLGWQQCFDKPTYKATTGNGLVKWYDYAIAGPPVKVETLDYLIGPERAVHGVDEYVSDHLPVLVTYPHG